MSTRFAKTIRPLIGSGRVLKTKLIRSKRKELGLTLDAAALAAGMHRRQAWYAIEAGKNKNVTVKTLKDIARVLKCTAGELIDE